MKKHHLYFLICILCSGVLQAQKKSKEAPKKEASTKSPQKTTSSQEIYSKPQMKVQLGHTGYIYNYAVSPDGKFLATASGDLVCKLWDIAAARELLTFRKDTSEINSLLFSLDGKYLLQGTGRHDKFLRVLDAFTGNLVRQLEVHAGMYRHVQIIPSTKNAVYMNRNPGDYNRLFIMNLTNGTNVRTLDLKAEISIFKVSQDGKFIMAAGQNSLGLWEASTGKVLQNITLERYTNYYDSMKENDLPLFTNDNQYLYYKDHEQIKRINLLSNVAENLPASVKVKEKFTMSHDGRYAMTSSINESSVDIYKLSDGSRKVVKDSLISEGYTKITDDGNFLLHKNTFGGVLIYDLKIISDKPITLNYRDIVIIPGSNYLIGRSYESGSMYLLDASSGRELREFKSYVKGASFSRFSPDGRYAIWVQDSVKLVLWDMFSGATFKTLQGHTDVITTLAFSNDGKLIVTGSSDKSLKLWDLESGKLIRSMSVYTKWISSIVFSPDDKYIAGQCEELTFKIWETATGKELKKYKGHTERVSCIAFAPDGKSVVSGSWDKTIKVWNIQTSTLLRTITGSEHAINSIAFSKDGTLLASGGGDKKFATFTHIGANKIRIINFSTGKAISSIAEPFNGTIIQMKFSDDMKYLATRTDVNAPAFEWTIVDLVSAYQQRIDLWRIADGVSVKSFNGNFQDLGKLFYQPGAFLYTDEHKIIHLSDLATGKDLKVFAGHTGNVDNISFVSDGKYLISRSNEDGFIKIWNMNDQQEALNYIILGGRHNDYLIYSPDNYYMCSKGGAKAVHFVRDLHVYEFEQFDLQYNRPDKVLGKLSGINAELVSSYSKAYAKRLKKMGFTEEMFSKELHMPVIKVDSKGIPLNTKSKTITLNVNSSDSKYYLDRINVYINDVPIYGSKGIDLKIKKLKHADQAMNLTLVNGINKIKINCMNEKGVESLSEYLEIFCDAPAYKPVLYLITIGVSKYKDGRMNLQFASKDAGDLVALFKENNKQFASVQSFNFVDEKATKENILSVKARLINGKPDDVVMVMVSGHGLLDSELDYYIATHDVDFNNPSARGLAYDALESILDGIPQRKKILFIDACHSGEVDKEEVQLSINSTTENAGNLVFRSFPGSDIKQIGLHNSFELMKELFADLRRGSGATVISSAGGAEYAIEGAQWNNGVFTFCLINGLREMKADLNKDGEVRLSEIEEYLQKQVPELTQGRQKPTSRAENLSSDFRVW
jgi:WD40 repeat protein